MTLIGLPFLILLAVAGGVLVLWLLVRLFRVLGWLLHQCGHLVRHVARFAGNEVTGAIRMAGGILTSLFLIPPILWNILFGRWQVAEHYGHAFEKECIGVARNLYRVSIGNPARLLGLRGLIEGLEGRLPEVVRGAPHEGPAREPGAFEGYRVVGTLPGGGSGARLYRAEPTRDQIRRLSRSGAPLPRQVVIKAFSLEGGSTLSQIVRESRSLEAARRLGLVLDHRLEDRRYYYVMPYVPGKDLSIVTRRLHHDSGTDGLDDARLEQAIGYLDDLLETLDRFHRSGLWHKDIKPSNVIISAGRAHLVDFGLVTPLHSAMTLTTHGTEYFRDPEMVRLALQGVKVHEVDGVKFDVYGAGAVLYSLLENSFPAHGSLSRISKRCPEALRWIVRRAMADLQQRYTSAREMLGDLRAVAGARDPFAVRPADLPSVRGNGGVLASLPTAPEPLFAGSPWPQPPPAASSPFPSSSPPPDASASSRSRWSGRRARRRGYRHRRVGPGVLIAGFLFLMFGSVSLLGVGFLGSRRASAPPTPLFDSIEPRAATTSHGLRARVERLRDRMRDAGATVSAGVRDWRTGGETASAGVGVGAKDLAGTILVLNDLPRNADPAVADRLMALRERLEDSRWDVLGLGGEPDEDALIDLLAMARKAAGIADARDPDAAARLARFLDDQEERIRAILWISEEEGSGGSFGRLVTRADTPIEDPSLRPLLDLLGTADGTLP